ncbi:unnamed protein product [Lepeophtheirus salmonis]|nr:unnamed protein product [Lepeophtheirus salmonis]CAF2779606.1 unnamed protein product [Lepeophtheirus salmonis]
MAPRRWCKGTYVTGVFFEDGFCNREYATIHRHSFCRVSIDIKWKYSTKKMNPLFIVLFATACVAVPTNYYPAGPHAGPYAAHHAAPYAAYHAAPYAVPAPITKVHQGPGSTSVHQAPAQVSEQVHLGQTSYVANVHHEIIKPPAPHFPIAVSKVLKPKTTINPVVSKTVTETHVVNKPVPVEKKVEVPYDVPVYETVIKEVEQPYAVPKHVEIPVPTPVLGKPIIKEVVGAPIVKNVHTAVHHGIGYTAGYAGHGYAAGYAGHGYPAGYAGHGYAAGYPAGYAGHGYAAGYPAGYAGHGYAAGYPAGYAGHGYAAGYPAGYAGHGYAAEYPAVHGYPAAADRPAEE